VLPDIDYFNQNVTVYIYKGYLEVVANQTSFSEDNCGLLKIRFA
jgi:hypothetical protein